MKRLRWVLALTFLACAGIADAQPDGPQRVALLIANADYTRVRPLSNPQRDAELVGAALRQAGFNVVTVHPNLGSNAFRERLGEFSEVAAQADIALVYYAGHGVEVDGKNWLIPTDANLTSKTQLMLQAVPLDYVLSAVSGAAQLRIVILDACRDNPFPALSETTRGGSTRGLAPVETSGFMVLYAAGEGAVAADGATGQNSPFARALAEHIPRPGLEMHLFPDLVAERTQELSPIQQRPVMYGSIGPRPMYFVPAAASAGPDPQVEFRLFRAAERAAVAGDCQPLREHRAAFPNSFSTEDADHLLANTASCASPTINFLATLRRTDTTPLTRADFEPIAARFGAEVEAVQAVAAIESSGAGGFAADGRPIILFERHLFSRKTNRQFDESHPEISNRTPGGYPRTQDERWAQLEAAYALDPEAALQSVSWGLFQTLGQNYPNLGMATAQEYVTKLARSERDQLEAFEGFVRANGLVDELQRLDWTGFAARYHGAGYATNRYDQLFAQAYAVFKGGGLGDPPIQCASAEARFRVSVDQSSAASLSAYLSRIPPACAQLTAAVNARIAELPPQ